MNSQDIRNKIKYFVDTGTSMVALRGDLGWYFGPRALYSAAETELALMLEEQILTAGRRSNDGVEYVVVTDWNPNVVKEMEDNANSY